MINEKKGLSKKCRRCSLDCLVLRSIVLAKIPENERAEKAKAMFTNEKPKYNSGTCPK